ncbi:MAG: hypothetical protein LBK58_10220 [Prevotellaceae bacterium]|jgi:hypothetical protein|nr:hypothetical protein [Prevotellaceae bacterium]
MNGKETSITGEIILYQPDNSIQLEVRIEDETVWLSQVQMAELFQTTVPNINLHLKNIFKEGELEEIQTVKDFLIVRQEGKRQVQRNSVVAKFATTAADGKTYRVVRNNSKKLK